MKFQMPRLSAVCGPKGGSKRRLKGASLGCEMCWMRSDRYECCLKPQKLAEGSRGRGTREGGSF